MGDVGRQDLSVVSPDRPRETLAKVLSSIFQMVRGHFSTLLVLVWIHKMV